MSTTFCQIVEKKICIHIQKERCKANVAKYELYLNLSKGHMGNPTSTSILL